MMKIAITGNIGAGKSVVEKLLNDMNYPVIDTDKIVHELFDNSQELNVKLRNAFDGYDIYDTDGFISRKKLAAVVFSNSVLLKKLEEIIHPLIIEKVVSFFESNSYERLCFVAVPLLYEANWTYLFDKVILVAASKDIRLHRLISKRKLTEEDALKRMDAQMPQEEKIDFADYVIYNNTDFNDLTSQINEILLQLL